MDDVFGNIPVIGEQLFCILGQAITAVPERRIVVPVADARVEANSVDDRLCIQTARFGIGVKLVEIGYAQREIGIGKQLDRLRFGGVDDQLGNMLFKRAFRQKLSKRPRKVVHLPVLQVGTHDNARRVQIIVQSLPFA